MLVSGTTSVIWRAATGALCCSVPSGTPGEEAVKKTSMFVHLDNPIECTLILYCYLSPSSFSKPSHLSLPSLIEPSEMTNFTSGYLKVNFLLSNLIPPSQHLLNECLCGVSHDIRHNKEEHNA